jgi:cytochrome c553
MTRSLLSLVLAAAALPAQAPPAVQNTEFFETHIRPLFASKCFGCHSEKVKMAGLNLKSAASFQALGQQRLLDALSYEGKYKMPPTGKLAAGDIARVREWLEMGAPYPAEAAVKAAVQAAGEKRKDHWAFQSVRKPAGTIDSLLLQSLRQKGLDFAPPADRRTLLRRVTFDLTGLPPTAAELAAFEHDGSFERVVDRLLASPHYGEKWGRHWLDVARYAESTGMDEDHGYPHAWRYRDYVVKAFNEDKPYNRFLQEQIAGDLLDGGENRDAIVATGFLALGPKPLAQQDRLKMVYDVVDEQIDTTSRAVLGVTLACARCHDHKFDPLTTKDYYGWAGILASTKNFRDNGRPGAVSYIYYAPLDKAAYARYQDHRTRMYAKQIEMEAAYTEELAVHDAAAVARLREVLPMVRRFQSTGEREASLDILELDRWLCALGDNRESVDTLVQQYQTGAKKWRDRLNGWRKRYAEEVALDRDLPARPMPSRGDGAFYFAVAHQDGPLVYRDSPRLAALRAEWKKLSETLPEEPPMASAVSEGSPVEQRVFVRGDHLSPGEPAPKSMPAVLAGEPFQSKGSGRLEMAQFLASPANPLTARVFVNRVWQWHFGEGLVRTPSNWGATGERPTHPELLDYLAARFVESGWSLKALHKEILLSRAYQMSTQVSPAARAADPANRLWSRFARRRLSVEELRDAMLALDGSLDRTVGGTVYDNSKKRPTGKPEDNHRRTLYSPVSRGSVPTMLATFDFGDATTSSEGRTRTTVAPQALFMMNSEFLTQRAASLASRLAGTPAAKVAQLYRDVLLRAPAAAEADQAISYVESLERRGVTAATAWASLCRVMLASSEFLYVD